MALLGVLTIAVSSVFDDPPISADAHLVYILRLSSIRTMMCGRNVKVIVFSFLVLLFAFEIIGAEDVDLVCHRKGDDCVLQSELLRSDESTGMFKFRNVFYFHHISNI